MDKAATVDPARLEGTAFPSFSLPATNGTWVAPGILPGTTVIYVHPRITPGDGSVLDGWDTIPGARGCTPQSCAFRDHMDDLRAAGANQVFGLSTQDTAEQLEARDRLHLPFQLLSDGGLSLADALGLPRFEAGGQVCLARVTLILTEGTIVKVFWPVSDPARNARDVLGWLRSRK